MDAPSASPNARRLPPYAAALVAAVIAAGLQFPLAGAPGAALLPSLAAVAIGGWSGGLRPALAAGAIGAAAAFVALPSPLLAVLIFAVAATLVGMLCETLHRDRRAAVEALRAAHESHRELSSSEDRFRRLADAVPVLVWIADPTKACTWFNRPWLQFTGRPLAQEAGYGWTEGIHPDDVDRAVRVYTTAFDAREVFEIDYRLRRHDGEFRWIVHRGEPLFDADGTFAGYVGGCVDIHERKQAEQRSVELLQVEQVARADAERAALMKDEFLSTVSHELRTPLTAILGWVQLLRQGGEGMKLEDALATIERNARAQVRIVEDLLDMSRILSGRLRLEVQRVRPADAIESALTAIEPSAAARQITIERDLDVDIGAVVGDPLRLQQIAWNLLSNAVKFTPPGGRVGVALRHRAEGVEIRVTDTGEGIAPEFLPHVFDRFRQADASTTRRHPGLGLGLSIVKQLAELHGGRVRAESAGLGRGATFIVTLPAGAANAGGPAPGRFAPAPPPSPAAPLAGLDTLLVDDDDDARELLAMILRGAGATVRTASSAAAALAEFDRQTPHVLVSDVAMPDEDGYQLLGQIRRRPRERGGGVPALALTAFARTEDRRHALEAGFQLHVAKPAEPGELIAAVGSLGRR